MGIPKFFRWISERYPLINEPINANNIGPIIDNFYLDMNGIIHNCSHNNNPDPFVVLSETVIFSRIFDYINKLFQIARPQKLMYLAIDGVAPRAKMNQQRQRRYKSAKDKEIIKQKLINEGKEFPKDAFDSTCITPGTEFMARLSENIRFYIQKKIKEDSEWRKIKIIFSGHEVPGEGEHKIVDYIRRQKALKTYDPNQTHCFYGLDADLIMLALATHEPNIVLLREDVLKRPTPQFNSEKNDFYYLHISLLREYFELEFRYSKDADGNMIETPNFCLEKVVDDIIAVCICIGNDFIPSLSLISINDGQLDLLFKTYKQLLQENKHINEGGVLNVKNFEMLIRSLDDEERKMHKTMLSLNEEEDAFLQLDDLDISSDIANVLYKKRQMSDDEDDITEDFAELNIGENRTKEEENEEIDNEWRDTYYKEKLEFPRSDEKALSKLISSYLSAIQWTLYYYYDGCASWSWFYPYHYSPLINDMRDLEKYPIDEFQLSEPFEPYQQLIGVIPPQAKDLLPKPYAKLFEPDSILAPYFPDEVEYDLNGKKNDWEAIVKLPFMPEEMIVKASKLIKEEELTPEEIQRNKFGISLEYMYDSNVKDRRITPNPELFESIDNCLSRCVQLKLPPIPEERSFKLLDGVIFGPNTIKCMPSFKSIEVEPSLEYCKIKIFQFPSNKETLLLTFKDTNVQLPEINKVMYLWPHYLEVLIEGIMNEDGTWVNDICPKNYTTKNLEYIKESFKQKGINTKNISTYACIRYSNGIERINGGGKKRRWSDDVFLVPVQQLTHFHPLNGDPRHRLKTKKFLNTFPHKYDKALSLHKDHFGKIGSIVRYIKARDTLEVALSPQANPFVSYTKNITMPPELKWFQQHQVCSILKTNANVIGRICSKLDVQFGKMKRNFGLGIKNTKNELGIIGYVKKDGDKWLFSSLTIEILQEYMEKFPEIFAYINVLKYGDKIEYKDVYINYYVENKEELDENIVHLNAYSKYSKLDQWVSSLPLKSLELVHAGSLELNKEQVLEIEKKIDEYAKIVESKKKKPYTIELRKKEVFLPVSKYEIGKSDEHDAYKDVVFNIGDRVIYVVDSGIVPYGSTGTIIGISRYELKILLDKKTVGGSDLNGLCSEMRGIKTEMESVFNLTKHAIEAKERRKHMYQGPPPHFKKPITKKTVQSKAYVAINNPQSSIGVSEKTEIEN